MCVVPVLEIRSTFCIHFFVCVTKRREGFRRKKKQIHECAVPVDIKTAAVRCAGRITRRDMLQKNAVIRDARFLGLTALRRHNTSKHSVIPFTLKMFTF